MNFTTNSQLRYSGTIKFSLSLFKDILQDVSGIIDGKQTMTVSVFHTFPYNCTKPAFHFIFLQHNNNKMMKRLTEAQIFVSFPQTFSPEKI